MHETCNFEKKFKVKFQIFFSEKYSEARMKLKDAELTSNLESDDEMVGRTRKRKINTRLQYPGEESVLSDSESDTSQPTRKVKALQSAPVPQNPYPKFKSTVEKCLKNTAIQQTCEMAKEVLKSPAQGRAM
jgi:hypothetical protein